MVPEPPPAELAPSCAEAGVLGVLPGIVGSIQALEAIKLILDLGDPLIGRLLTYDSLDQSFREYKLQRGPDQRDHLGEPRPHRGRRARRALHAHPAAAAGVGSRGFTRLSGEPAIRPLRFQPGPARAAPEPAARGRPPGRGRARRQRVGHVRVPRHRQPHARRGRLQRARRVLGADVRGRQRHHAAARAGGGPGRLGPPGRRASAPDRSSGGPRSSAAAFSIVVAIVVLLLEPRCSRAGSTTTACS